MDYKKLAALLFPGVTATREDLENKYPPRRLPDGAIVSRMAPSPTGFVHLGNLVQGLCSERLCRNTGGVLFLRVEDTDAKREVAGATESLINGLSHYKIKFDEGAAENGAEVGEYGPYRQRARAELYHVFAKELVERGLAYPCFYTEAELAKIRGNQEKHKKNFGIYGEFAVWRDRDYEEVQQNIKAGKSYVLRFKSEGNINNKIRFTDLIKGELELTENDIDHVLLKSDGIPTYHFAHVVDDHLMRTTHIVRGDEWLSTLPLHLQLFRALEWKPPKYLHIGPLMKMDGNSKRKLSKRKDPELALAFYEEEGYPAATVYEYIMTILNSNFEDWRRANPAADVEDFKFSHKKMNPAGSLFDRDKLNDISKNVIAAMSAEEVVKLLCDWAKKYDREFFVLLSSDKSYAGEIFALGRGGKKPRKDIAVWKGAKEYAAYFYDELFTHEINYPNHITAEDVKAVLNAFIEVYDPSDDGSAWFEKVKSICAPLGFTTDVKAYKKDPAAHKGSVADVATIIRIAVTGRSNTPDLCSIMKLLGQERSINRIKQAINNM